MIAEDKNQLKRRSWEVKEENGDSNRERRKKKKKKKTEEEEEEEEEDEEEEEEEEKEEDEEEEEISATDACGHSFISHHFRLFCFDFLSLPTRLFSFLS